MASNPVGTMYVELDLDATKYTKAQKDILAGAQQNSADINKVFKTVGTQSDEMYNAMRLNVQNALNAIKQSHLSSADEIRRAQESAAAKISEINQKQFGEQTTFIDGIKANWLVATAAIAAAMGVVSKAMEYINEGAKAMQAEESFQRTAQAAGLAGDQIDEFKERMKQAAAGTVDDSDIMQKAVKGFVLGLDPEQMVSIMETARVSARVAGQDVKDAYEKITDAIATGMPKALKQYGLVTKEEAAVVQAALKAGVEDVNLYSIAMMNAGIQAEKMGQMTGNAAEFLQKMKAHSQDTAESIGMFLVSALQKAYGFMQFLASGVLTVAAAFPLMLEGMSKVSAKFYEMTGQSDKAAAAETDALKLAGTVNDMMAAAQDLAAKGVQNMTGQAEASKAIDNEKIARLQKEKAEYIANLKEQIDAKKNADKIAKDILAEETKRSKEYYESAIQDADHWLKMQKLTYASDLNYSIDVIDQKMDALDKWYDDQADSINKHVRRESEKQAKLAALDAEYTKQYKAYANQRQEKAVEVAEFEMKARQSYITWERKQAADQMIFDRSNAGERITLEASVWEKAQYYQQLTGQATKENHKETLEGMIRDYEETFVGGWKAGMLEVTQNQITWGEVTKETAKSTFKGMSDSFSTFFEDVYQGKLKSLGDYASTIWDSTRKAFFKMIADMAAQKIMAGIVLTLTNPGGATASALSVIDKLLSLTGVTDWLGSLKLADSWFTPSSPGDIWYEGGRIPYTSGGHVAGRAGYPGNHPGNDVVPAWLSPGEYVVPRTGVNADTLAILEHIRAYGSAPGYADGGKVSDADRYKAAVNKIDPMQILYIINGAEPGETPYYKVSTPTENPLWKNFANLYNIGGPGSLEYMMNDPLAWWKSASKYNLSNGSGDPLAGPLEPLKNPIALAKGVTLALQNGMQIYQVPKSSGGFSGIAGFFNDLEDSIGSFGSSVSNSLQSVFTPNFWKTVIQGGTMAVLAYAAWIAGPAMAAEMGAMAEGLAAGKTMAEIEAGLATAGGAGAGGAGAAGAGTSALVYGSPAYEAALSSLGISSIEDFVAYLGAWTMEDLGALASGKLGEMGLKKIGELGVNKLIASGHNTSGGGFGSIDMDVNWSGGSALKDLGSFGGMIGEHAYSAKNGLAYVPRDNFLINAHQGEAVLTAEENRERMGGGSLIAEIRQLRRNSAKLLKFIDDWDMRGMPDVRTA